jgi:hypothetical protein
MLLPMFPADHRTASMTGVYQPSAGRGATKGKRRSDHPGLLAVLLHLSKVMAHGEKSPVAAIAPSVARGRRLHM